MSAPTANQIVAYNLTQFRKASGLSQGQLGQLLGWSNVAVSSAERSWAGVRVRKFDADEIVMLAGVLGVPVAAMFLPPPGPEGRPSGALADHLREQLAAAHGIDVRVPCGTCGGSVPPGLTCNTCERTGR